MEVLKKSGFNNAYEAKSPDRKGFYEIFPMGKGSKAHSQGFTIVAVYDNKKEIDQEATSLLEELRGHVFDLEHATRTEKTPKVQIQVLFRIPYREIPDKAIPILDALEAAQAQEAATPDLTGDLTHKQIKRLHDYLLSSE